MAKGQSERETDLLTITQAAALLNVSAVSLRRWTDSGRLPCLRVGARRERRFRRQDLMAMLEHEAGGPGFESAASVKLGGSTQEKSISLAGVKIDQGSHLCSVYETDLGRTKLSVPFLLDGLASGDFCVLVASPETQNHLLSVMREQRASLGQDLADGRLILTDGITPLSRMLVYWEESLIKAMQSGFTGFRALGDMAWTADKGVSQAELTDFEMRFDQTIAKQFPLVSLCQYDARRFDGTGVLHAVCCHPDTHALPISRFLGS